MITETKVSLTASDLWPRSREEALSFANEHLGNSKFWQPSLVAYRLGSDFQDDWKVEVGFWLLAANQFGFLTALIQRITRARKESLAPAVTGPNDSAHRILLQELAPAMTVYYFARCGWTFVNWEPAVSAGDVDVRLRCPHGVVTDIQVKAPDRPGQVQNYQIHDGECDSHVLSAIDKALKQLSASPSPQRMVVVSAQRTYAVAPMVLTSHLYGKPSNVDNEVVLSKSARGAFATASGANVGAVVDLHLSRGVGATLYRSTVLLNPWAANTPSPDVFRGSRV